MQCPTGKSVIPSYEVAEKARKRSTNKHSQPTSTYRCAICGALHLGKPNRPKKRIKTIQHNHELRMT